MEFLRRLRKERTMSESSDNSLDGATGFYTQSYRLHEPEQRPRQEDVACSPAKKHHATSAEEGHFFYELEGKVHYSYYEKHPEFYDIDGKHRYK